MLLVDNLMGNYPGMNKMLDPYGDFWQVAKVCGSVCDKYVFWVQMNELINGEGVCRTAPATPGLLIM